MSYARAIFLGLALASGCAGETFDLLPSEQTQAGDGGRAGQGGALAGSGGSGGRQGIAGTGGSASPGGSGGSSSECASGSCYPYCQVDRDCGPGVCLLIPMYPGRCVQCIEEDRCSGDENCDSTTNSCETACERPDPDERASPDCPRSRPLCSLSRNNVCVECIDDSDCANPARKRCNWWDARCVECVSNRDCANPTPVCQQPGPGVLGNTCRVCRSNLDCAEGFECNTGSCVSKYGAEPNP